MQPVVTISVIRPDTDHVVIDVVATSGRYTGSAWLYTQPDELGRLADRLDGFPASASDRRDIELGSKDLGYAGGFVAFSFHTINKLGAAVVEIEIEDDGEMKSPASARFVAAVEPADVDRFVYQLRTVESQRAGVAALGGPT